MFDGYGPGAAPEVDIFKRIDNSPAYQLVCDVIESEILNGRLPTGSKLPTETTFAETFGLTRHTVREGLRILEQSGLVRRGPGRRLFVGSPLYTELAPRSSRALVLQQVTFQELFEMQTALELSAAEFASERVSSALLKAMEKNLEEMKKLDRHGGSKASELEQEFHGLVAQATKNRALMVVREPIALLFFPTLSRVLSAPKKSDVALKRSIIAHETILEAIRTGDGEKAIFWMRKHMNDFHAGCENHGVDMDAPIAFPSVSAAV